MTRFTNLPNTIYTVKVPLLATLDEYDMLSGELPYKEGSDGTRIKQHNDMCIIGINIDKMLEIYSNGFPIRVLNKEDLFDIYNNLKHYVLDTDRDNLISINQRAHDDERIPDIKRFLEEIFENNKHLVTEEERRNSLGSIMDRMIGGNFLNLSEKEVEEVQQRMEIDKIEKPKLTPTVEQSTFLGSMLTINKIAKPKSKEPQVIRREI